ncbi:hypothetical protein [Massilia agri]|uniref:Uncharacterized protein n=1 Tax=Massilia agri TaxID=1886785 RepID=A0ABT2ARJ6_9BURK|nr:hypothetical protein [Massilia agri]MCS0598560.1 hypothetical protein [Massilia agri]
MRTHLLRAALRTRFILSCLVLCTALAGCSLEAWIGLIATPDEQARAHSLVDRLRARDYVAIERALRADLRTPELREALDTMAAAVPVGEPRSVTIVSAHKNTKGGVTWLTLNTEYEFATGWMLATVTTEMRDGARSVIAFHVYPRAQSLAAEHGFSLAGKSMVQYGVLVAALAAFALSLYALYRCVRTKGLAKKALWVLFILVSFGQLAVDWTSGEWRFVPLHLELLGASFMAPLGGSWILTASLPVGAIVFLLRERNGALPMRKTMGSGGRPDGITAGQDGTAAPPQAPRQ